MTTRSPVKRASSLIPTLPKYASKDYVPSSPTRTRMSPSKTSLAASSRTNTMTSFDSSFVESEDGFSPADLVDVREEKENEKPRRKAGFGTPRKQTARATTTTTTARGEDENGKRENVVVCVRVRPSRQKESEAIYHFAPQTGALALAPSHPVVQKRGAASVSSEYEFAFDALVLPPSTSEALYESKIKQVVLASTKGFNGTVFAYGQTSSGKTHTMLGTPEEPGVIPLSIRQVFDEICAEPNRSFSLRVSFLEIYNETINDLLSSTASSSSSSAPAKKALDVASNGSVKGLTERAVSTPEQVMALVEEATENRRTGATDWNERSSRGHCLFSLTIESLHKTTGEARTSKLHLIDLAGSESATAQEERRKEGAFINRSLLTLGTVISKLAEGTNSHIPYRDSKLTRLLQPALSGNSRVAIIVAISPDLPQATETLSSLRFARRAKMVETKAERGVMISDQILLKQYADQVERLKAQIREREEGQGGNDATQVQARMDELLNANQQAQDELARKELELTALKTQLEQVNSLILTGASMEVNTRRSSSSFASMMSPRASKRSTSGMSGLGLGTPKARNTSRFEPMLDDRSDELEELKEQLERSNARIAELESRVTEVDLLKRALEDERSKHAHDVEAWKGQMDQLSAAKAQLEDTVRQHANERDRLETMLSSLRLELEQAAPKAARLDAALGEVDNAKADSARLANQIATLKDELRACERKAAQAEQRLAAAEERDAKDTRDETIASLQREIAFAKKELQTVVTTKATTLAAVKEQLATVETERDLAQRMVEEANAKAKALADIEELNAKERELSIKQIRSESEAAVSQAQSDVKRVQAELSVKNDRIEQLERTIERFKALENQRSSSLAIQKSSTDSLRSRIADLQARSNTPSSLNSSQRSSTGGDPTTVVELQVRNGELVSRVADLEKQLSAATQSPVEQLSTSSAEELARLVSTVEEQARQLRESQASIEEWKSRFLAAQKLQTVPASPFSRSASLASDENVSPPRSRLSNAVDSPSTPHRKTPSISTYAFDKPPPLPYSPHQRDNKERKHRRETIARDLAMLREERAVERTKTAIDSPSASPRKNSNFDDHVDESVRRGKKSSTDSARLWT